MKDAATVKIDATLAIPVLPNFLQVSNVRGASLDSAHDVLTVDVGELNDQALQDFCNAWVLAFTRHAKARRK